MAQGVMNEQLWSDVDQYFAGLLNEPDAALEAALADAEAANLPAINVAANQGKLLYLLALSANAGKILEIGTLAGYSTIWLARALKPNGKLISLEYLPAHAEVARKNIARAGLADKVEVRVGAALESLPKLLEEGQGPFDMIFIDADKPPYTEYLQWSLKLSRPGTLIVADNVVREGKVVDADSSDENVLGMRRFAAVLGAEPRLSATVLQTVGSKGHDGLAFAVVIS